MEKPDFTSIIASGRYAYGRLALGGDIMDSPFKDFVLGLKLRGADTFQEDGVFHMWGPAGTLDLGADVSALGTLIAAGAYICNLPLGGEMGADNLSSETPAFLPGSQILEGEDPENMTSRQLTWGEYLRLPGKDYRTSIDGTKVAFPLRHAEKMFDSPIFAQIAQLGYVQIHTWKNFITLLNGSEYLVTE